MAGKAGRRGWGFIRKLPSKKFQASYIGPDLQRHTAPHTFSRKLDAEFWLGDERRRIEQDDWTAPALRAAEKRATQVTLGEYAEKWIAERNVKPRTRLGYESLYANHIREMLGRVPLKHLTGETVRTWFASLGKEHTTRNGHAYGLLHAVCATAVSDGLLTTNPCTITGVTNTPRKREPLILTPAEVAALADATEPKRLRMLILISAWCGLRWGEGIELRRRDVADDHAVLSVGRAVTHRKGCRIDTPKSGKPRMVVVPPHIRADLAAHMQEHVGASDDALLFPAVRGCHLNDRVFRDYLTPALESINRKGLRIHDLRHFAGTQTARVANLKETMDRLGHSTVKASLIYQKAVDGRDHEVAAALSKLAVSDAPTTG
ncbi:tyrosine-type recombinase/integrase [Mycobacterium riyadhense]|uniref:tyrosine-type recombinase/integrase n=1 Tax=Mycobacterium riyadhense TaxID=486698 RepID=UPI00195BA794|nr:site-specific integrase [Mycobacterium riyadhense]